MSDSSLKDDLINHHEDLIKLLRDENSALREALGSCIYQLNEVRTGDDFEGYCWDVAEKAQKLLSKVEGDDE